MKEKQLTDKNGKTIVKETIVHFQNGWCRVKSICVGKQTVNLAGIFNDKIYNKNVPLADIYEDYEAWSLAWSKTETYQSM